MKLPVSIVIPTKNEEAFLPLLLASIQEQEIQPLEVIVADANSSDKTVEIATSFGAKIVEGGLPGPGRNNGAAMAKGKYILFLDADVVFPNPSYLQNVIKTFEASDLDVATVDVSPIDANLLDKFSHAFYNRYVRLLGKVHPHAPGFFILVKREVHERIEGFDEEVTFCEDHDYVHRAGKIANFGILDKEIKIPVSTRRLDRDGRLVIFIKYILAELHIWLFGAIKHDYFNYQFGYPKKK